MKLFNILVCSNNGSEFHAREYRGIVDHRLFLDELVKINGQLSVNDITKWEWKKCPVKCESYAHHEFVYFMADKNLVVYTDNAKMYASVEYFCVFNGTRWAIYSANKVKFVSHQRRKETQLYEGLGKRIQEFVEKYESKVSVNEIMKYVMSDRNVHYHMDLNTCAIIVKGLLSYLRLHKNGGEELAQSFCRFMKTDKKVKFRRQDVMVVNNVRIPQDMSKEIGLYVRYLRKQLVGATMEVTVDGNKHIFYPVMSMTTNLRIKLDWSHVRATISQWEYKRISIAVNFPYNGTVLNCQAVANLEARSKHSIDQYWSNYRKEPFTNYYRNDQQSDNTHRWVWYVKF